MFWMNARTIVKGMNEYMSEWANEEWFLELYFFAN